MRSVCDQTYKNVELIVVDNQSTDDSVRVARKFDATVIETDWKLLGARYEAVKASKGEYVLFLDFNHTLIHDTIDRLLMQSNNVKSS